MHWRYRLLIWCGLVPAAIGAALALRLTITHFTSPGLPTFITFYPAVILTALAAGFWPGFMTTLLSAGFSDYGIIPPLGRLSSPDAMESVGLVLFIAMGMLISIVSARYRRSRFHLEELVNERTKHLAESEEKYRNLFETVTQGFYLCELMLDETGKPFDWRFLEVNPAGLKVMNMTEEQVVGKTRRQIMPQMNQVLLDEYAKVALTGVPVEHEYFGEMSQRWHYVSISSPKKGFFTVVSQDITARKKLEEERERLLNEARESQEQNAEDLKANAMLQRIGTLFIREGNMPAVFTEIVDAAIALSGADFGNIQLLDPQSSTLRIVASRGFPQWWIDFWDNVSKGRGSCGTAMEKRERIIVEDVEKSAVFAGSPALEMQLKAGVRAVQSTPLISRSGKILGMFSTHYKTPHAPDDRALRLLDILSRHAADIIERAQAEEALKQSEKRLEMDLDALTRMHTLSGRLVQTEGLQPLLREIMDVATAIMHADQGTLQLLEGECLRIVAHHGHTESFLEFFASAENRASACGEATRIGERVVVPDIEASPLFIGTPSLAVLREAGVRAVQSTPIRTRNGMVLGILTTQWGYVHAPDEHDLWRLDLLVRQTADLIEQSKAQEALRENERNLKSLNENLEKTIAQRTQQVRVLSKELTIAEQRERQRFSQALHEDLQQILFSAKIVLDTVDITSVEDAEENVKDICMAKASIQKAIATTKSLAVELNPPILKNEGLDAALRWLARHMEERYGLVICVDISKQLSIVKGIDRILIIQLVRELLFNIVKHAQTQEVVVSGVLNDNNIAIRVEDKGLTEK